jgi:hypothetical protein
MRTSLAILAHLVHPISIALSASTPRFFLFVRLRRLLTFSAVDNLWHTTRSTAATDPRPDAHDNEELHLLLNYAAKVNALERKVPASVKAKRILDVPPRIRCA